MKSWRTFVIAAAAVAAVAAPAYAQEHGPGPGTVELTIIPGGGLFFASGASESKFRNYDVGGALAVNLNKYIGVEAEGSTALGVYHQRLAVGSLSTTEAPPNIVDFSGNVTVSAPPDTYHVGAVHNWRHRLDGAVDAHRSRHRQLESVSHGQRRRRAEVVRERAVGTSSGLSVRDDQVE